KENFFFLRFLLAYSGKAVRIKHSLPIALAAFGRLVPEEIAMTTAIWTKRFILAAAAMLAAGVWLAPGLDGQEKGGTGLRQEDDTTVIDRLMAQWDKDVRDRISKDEKLKAIAAKNPLVILHSRAYASGGRYGRSAFSFVHETSDPSKHRSNVQLLFH